MSATQLAARLRELSELVDARIRAIVRIGDVPFAPLGAMQAYHLGWYGADLQPLARPMDAGKRLRPALCLLVCEALCGDVAAAAGVAAAIELLHNFSLVHDDIQDQSPTRRYRPTVWATWGPAQAINVGDALFATVQLAVVEDAALGCAQRVEAIRLLNLTSLRLVEGQYLDLALQGSGSVDLDAYQAMIERKTAALIATSAALGGVCAGAEDEAIAPYRAFGQALGVAFQYQDDVLGVWGDERVTGKSTAADIRGGKKGLPAVLAFAYANAEQAEELHRLYAPPERDEQAATRVMQVFQEIRVRSRAEAMVAERFAEALRWLDDAPGDPRVKQVLTELVASLRTRAS